MKISQLYLFIGPGKANLSFPLVGDLQFKTCLPVDLNSYLTA